MDSAMSFTDVLATPVWLAANVFLGVGAWRVTQRLFPRDTLSNLLLHATILSYACVLVVGMALGAIGLLCKRPAEHVGRGRSVVHAGGGRLPDQAGFQRWGSSARSSSLLAPGSIAGRRVSASRR